MRSMVMVLGLQDQGDTGKMCVIVAGLRGSRKLSGHDELGAITSSVTSRFLPRYTVSLFIEYSFLYFLQSGRREVSDEVVTESIRHCVRPRPSPSTVLVPATSL
jgi:hypothetical protein